MMDQIVWYTALTPPSSVFVCSYAILIHSPRISRGGCTSFLNRASHTVTRRYNQPQNLRYPPKLTNPYSKGVLRKYLFANSGELNAKKTVNDKKYPVLRPIVCAVEAYDKLSVDNNVNAHPTITSDPHSLVRTIHSDILRRTQKHQNEEYACNQPNFMFRLHDQFFSPGIAGSGVHQS